MMSINNAECPICYSHVSEENQNTTLKCQHKYHTSCIKKWILEYDNRSCPYCRNLVQLSDICVDEHRVLKKERTGNGIILTIHTKPYFDYTIFVSYMLFNRLDCDDRLYLYDQMEKVIDPNISDNQRENIVHNILQLMGINND